MIFIPRVRTQNTRLDASSEGCSFISTSRSQRRTRTPLFRLYCERYRRVATHSKKFIPFRYFFLAIKFYDCGSREKGSLWLNDHSLTKIRTYESVVVSRFWYFLFWAVMWYKLCEMTAHQWIIGLLLLISMIFEGKHS